MKESGPAQNQRRNPRTVAARRAKSETSSRQALEVLQKFRLIFRSVRKHFRGVEELCGVSGAQLWVLSELAQAPGLRVSEIAQVLSIHQSTASNMLDKLERRGLVKRRRGGPDQRVVRVFLTPSGDKIVAIAPSPARGALTDALGNLPAETLQNLDACLNALIADMEIEDEADAMRPLSDF